MPVVGERLTLDAVELLNLRAQREGGWCAAQLRVEQGPAAYVGHHLAVSGVIPGAEEGRWYAVEVSYAPHPTYGPQWRIERAVPSTPITPKALVSYLAGTIPGIGPQRARDLVKRFGDRLPSVLNAADAEQQLIAASILKVKVIRGLVAAWRAVQDQARTDVTLLDAGCSMGQIARIRTRFGAALTQVLANDPYRLVAVRGVSFTQADAVARAIGIAAEHPRRIAAAAVHLLREAADDGHCWTPWVDLVQEVAELLHLSLSLTGDQLDRQLASTTNDDDALIVRDPQQRCWLRGLWLAQQIVLKVAAQRIATPRQLGAAHTALPPVNEFPLTTEQAHAVAGVIGYSLVVLTGGPGTGKTTVVKTIIATVCARVKTPRIRLAAPTGKAARRLSESTGMEATTIHRLLEWAEDGPKRTSDKPLVADLVVVDEASMLDLNLAAALMAALPAACRLLLVGDVDQLPPVGPGQVLADLIAGGAATYRLTAVHRQAGGSLILTAAHAVNQGQPPVSGRNFDHDDLFVIPLDDEQAVVDRVVRMVTTTITAQRGITPTDIRVLAPIYKGTCGIDALNERLREHLNPPGPHAVDLIHGERTFRTGDRLVWLTNTPEHGLVNGEELLLSGIQRTPTGTQIELTTDDGKRLILPLNEVDARLAYALSVHKSQGSEYAAVIVVLHRSAWPLLERRLLYTAITRAKKLCLIVGEERALRRAVTNHETQIRRSGLADDLRQRLRADSLT
jgi:exodeoxyribonuclease V alpha subunit